MGAMEGQRICLYTNYLYLSPIVGSFHYLIPTPILILSQSFYYGPVLFCLFFYLAFVETT